MPLADLVTLFRFVGALACPVLYIVAFASQSWVTTDNRAFGLWTWCYTNLTDSDNVSDFVNDSSRCHSIGPGESPGYYEAVRVLACFTLVVFVCFSCTCNEKEGLGKDKNPVVVAVAAFIACGITVAVMGDNYGDDERWKSSGHKLGWCYWLAVSSCIMSFLMVFITYKYIDMRQKAANTTVTPAASSNNAPASNTNTNDTGSVSNAGSSTTSGASSSSSSLPPKSNIPTTSTTTATTTNTSTSNRFPILEPPPYEILREPVDYPASPPPSYEDVIGSDSAYGPAPRAHLP